MWELSMASERLHPPRHPTCPRRNLTRSQSRIEYQTNNGRTATQPLQLLETVSIDHPLRHHQCRRLERVTKAGGTR